MYGKKIIMNESNSLYIYDGSMAGFFTCAYEAVYNKEMPASITPESKTEPTLLLDKFIETDNEKADKVKRSVREKISPDALQLAENVFLSCLKEKETAILKFLILGYEFGGKIMDMIGHKDVAPLFGAEKHLHGECHLLKGFIRFSDYNGKLVAIITPKNFVLPFLTEHFITRYPNEEFMIYDKTNKTAFIYESGEGYYINIDEAEYPNASGKEEKYQLLWKQFYKTISIKERYNPKCRMSHMPKRYWENMTEMKELL